MEKPFYERYPSEFKEKGGAAVFREDMYVSESHDRYLPEYYFPLVMQVNTFPRYKNQRGLDPQMKMFLDQTKTDLSSDWGLPIPNEEAAYISMAKYAKDILPMTHQQVWAMNLAWEWTERHFEPYMGNSKIRTVDEAISKLDMDTSSGFPFNIHYAKKRDLFEQMPQIRDWLETDFETLADDPEWTCIFKNSLKEELRLKEKIEENSIRTFTASATDGTVHGNRLFGDMNDKMNESHLKTSSCVGMSPLKGNWDRLLRKLGVFKNGYALDEKQYDSSLRSFMMWGCAQFRFKMLAAQFRTERNKHRIQTYYRNLINTVIVTPEGLLIMKLGGNPSGSPNTINDNTLILYMLMCYAWIMLHVKAGKDVSYTEFETNTAKALVGDDNTWTVSDEFHETYNATSVINEWKIIGITTTTDSLEPRFADQLDFLSAHTVYHKGMAIPVYERAKLMTSMLYAKTDHLTPAKTLERAGGLMINGWSDLPMRNFTRSFVQWLIEKYDSVCYNDPNWIVAKAGILPDGKLEDIYLNHQGYYSETQERLLSTIKQEMAPRQAKKKNGPPRRKGPAPKGRVTRTVARPQRGFTNPPGKPRVRRVGKKKSTEQPWWEKLGGALGSFAGKAGVAGLKAIGGFGDYTVQTNSLLAEQTAGRNGSEVPMMINGKVSNVIRHREYIGDVLGSTLPFKAVHYAVNPGLKASFPWLAPIAGNFTAYRMRGLVYEIKSLSSDFSATQYLGYVAMASQYNSLDAPYTDKKSMENSEYSNSCKPSEDLYHPIECMKSQLVLSELYVRTGPPQADSDRRLYDLCDVTVATGGQNTNGIIGELWATYEIEFYQAKMQGADNQLLEFAYYTGTGCSTAEKFGIGTLLYDTIGVDMNVGSFSFAPEVSNGFFMVQINWKGTTTAGAGTYSGLAVNGTLITTQQSPEPLVGCFQTSVTYVVQVLNPNFELAISGDVPPGSVVSMFISQIVPFDPAGPLAPEMAPEDEDTPTEDVNIETIMALKKQFPDADIETIFKCLKALKL